MPRSSGTHPGLSPDSPPTHLTKRMSMAIMAVDPGETNGVALMHLYANSRSKKLPNHTVVRFRSWQFDLPKNTIHQDRQEALFATERDYHVPDPFLRYTRAAQRLLQIWEDFRKHSIRYYSISPKHTWLVLEDWLMPPMIKTRKRETLSPIYVTHRLVGMLYGMADVQEKMGFGPRHVGSIGWITPTERGADNIFSDDKLDRAGLLLKPKSNFDHANDATRIGLAFARKHPNIPGLITPYTPDPNHHYDHPWNRPDPMENFGRPREEDNEPGVTTRPVHLADGYAADPADPRPRVPVKKRLLGRAGQPTLARAAGDQTIAKKGMGRPKRPKGGFGPA